MEKGTVVANRFEIERELGRSSTGAVYRAVDRKFGIPVALKITPGATATQRDLYKREAAVGDRLPKGAGFVRVLDTGDTPDGGIYLAEDLIEEARPIDLEWGATEERLFRVLDAARLVAKAHGLGAIHGELTPRCFLQGKDGGVHLADFAAGARVEQVTLGTPPWRAPEQDKGITDAKSDVYALGVMLFVGLTGSAPFGTDPAKIALAREDVRAGRLPAPRPKALDGKVKDAVDLLAMRSVALDPAGRPDAAEFVRQLEEAIGRPLDGDKPQPWLDWITRMTAILAVLAALSSGRWGASNLYAILEQGKINDSWSYFQSKSVKGHIAEKTRALAKAVKGDVAPNVSGDLAALIASMDDEIGRLKDDKKQVEEEAHAYEANRDKFVEGSFWFEIAFAALQIGVIMCTIAAATKKKGLFSLSILFGAVGIAILVNGLLRSTMRIGLPAPGHVTKAVTGMGKLETKPKPGAPGTPVQPPEGK